jgi:hypothetical protein
VGQKQAAHYPRTIHRTRLTLRVHLSTDFVLLSRRRQSCNERDRNVLVTSGKSRSVRPRGWSCLSFSTLSLCYFSSSILLCSCSPLPFLALRFSSRYLVVHPFQRRNTGVAVVTIIEQRRKRTRRGQRSGLFTAASRRELDTRKTADKHETHNDHSQRPKEEL